MFSYSKVSPPVSPPSSPLPTSFSSYNSPPLSPTGSGHSSRNNAASKRYKYLRRIFKYRQMDFEYASWQIIYLFIAPQKVYRNFQYRKQTKDQWARDDPAFLVLLTCCLCVSSIVFSIILGLSFGGFLKTLIWIIFVDGIGAGLIVATIMWFLSNRYLLIQPHRGNKVEWGYAFDVHLNGLFPMIIITHIIQLLFVHFIYNQAHSASIIATLIGNTHWLIGIGYYIYLTFLGYSTLPFINGTRVFLFPLTLLVILYILSLIFRWNLTRALCFVYATRAFQG